MKFFRSSPFALVSRTLLLSLLATLPIAAAAQRNLKAERPGPAPEGRVALVIGNSAYKDAPLANPVNDASDIAKALQDSGFRVILRRNVGTREMRQAIREFGDELRRAEVGLFYFAGHGMQVRGANYLVPVGADIQNEADVEDIAIDAQYALRTMEEAQVKVSIAILDACRNNPFARSFRSASRGLAQMTAATGSLIAFATAPGSVAADGAGRNGVYTKHLLANLRGPDTDILKVFQRTRAGVVKETGGRQTPWESTSLMGDFYFRSAGLTAASVAPVPAEPPPSQVASMAPAPTPVKPSKQATQAALEQYLRDLEVVPLDPVGAPYKVRLRYANVSAADCRLNFERSAIGAKTIWDEIVSIPLESVAKVEKDIVWTDGASVVTKGLYGGSESRYTGWGFHLPDPYDPKFRSAMMDAVKACKDLQSAR